MAPAAPKKKAGGAAAKGSDAPHSDKELLQRAEAEALSLRRQLEQKHAEVRCWVCVCALGRVLQTSIASAQHTLATPAARLMLLSARSCRFQSSAP
jgi:cobalamin biosynthesis protein CbiG